VCSLPAGGVAFLSFKIKKISISGNIAKSSGNLSILPKIFSLYSQNVGNGKYNFERKNTMTNFTVPTREEVSSNNQAIFDNLKNMIGFVPNLYAFFAKNETALADYLALQNRKSTLRAKEREIINLVVSQVNECEYCLAAHTAIGKMQGFTAEQIIEVRKAEISFDAKFDALAKFVKETATNRGRTSAETTAKLLAAGYTEANLVDIIIVIGDKIITNYLHSVTQIPVDWEAASKLEVSANA
jgi:uncharacterized peroxidase-related enzyme